MIILKIKMEESSPLHRPIHPTPLTPPIIPLFNFQKSDKSAAVRSLFPFLLYTIALRSLMRPIVNSSPSDSRLVSPVF